MQHVNGPLNAKITLPGVKSITLRAILLASLADGVSEITGIKVDPVVSNLLKALTQLGIVTQLDEVSHSCIIAGCNGKLPKKQATVWCDRSKTIARYLICACAGTSGVYYFDSDPALRKHSFLRLINMYRLHGVQIIPGDVERMPFTLIGADSLEGGDMSFEDKNSAQLLPTLLMSAPYARSPFHFSVLETIDHQYIDMTASMMAEFGVLVHRIPNGQLMVPVPQRYQARDYYVEPDLSLGLYFFAAAAMVGGEITTQPVKRAQSKQPAIKYLSTLERMGCKVTETYRGLTVRGAQELHGLELSLHTFSHAFVVFSMIAPFAKTKTRITHIGGIRSHEINLMLAIRDEFVNHGVNIETGDNWIDIYPSVFKPGALNARKDEHLAMGFSLIALKVPGIHVENVPDEMHIFSKYFSIWNRILQPSNVNA